MNNHGSSHLNQAFTFKQAKNTVNKLVNKNIPGLSVSENSNVVECRDSQTQSSIVKAENPLEYDHCLSYFEVQVLGVAAEDTINVGVIAKDNTNKQVIGKSNHSFGYYKGDLFLNKKKVTSIVPFEKLKAGDCLGIGINCHNHTFLVVKNNKIISSTIPVPPQWNEFYPAVGVSNEGERVSIIFHPKEFKFNYLEKLKEIESQVQTSIKKEQVNNSQIYPLIYEYLEFNGCSKMQEKEKMYRVPRLTLNPGISHPSINLDARDNHRMVGEDDDMNQPLKFRHRIMSERLDDREMMFMLPDEVRRKNTEINGFEQPRKDSHFSNISNISNYIQSEENFYREEEQNELMDEPQTETENFLLTDKIEIIRLIKGKQIESAIELIEKTIPELLKEGHILAFLKAHIFLRIVREESNLAGVRYSQREKSVFEHHLGTLFPFYSEEAEGVEWKVMKNIYTALTYNVKNAKEKSFDMLSDKQFDVFGNYMNCLILKKTGYLGCSRLGLCVNNSIKVLEKLKSYKGQTCGVELTI